VKTLGGNGTTTPTTRTAEQTEIGIFWAYDGAPNLCTPPRLYNQVLQQIALQQGNTLVQNARLFALANIAEADAGIASWETKFKYDVARPVTALREGDADGNPATAGDVNWTPLGAPYSNGTGGDADNFTPPFPAYTSGHATFGGAIFRTLERFYGTDKISFTLRSDEFNGTNKNADGTVRPVVVRKFTSFTQASVENARSRIYLGIHWAFDATEGIKLGNSIADNAFNKFLTSTITSDQRFVTQLYRDLLNRNPDAGGLASWVENLAKGKAFVSGGIITSPEYRGVKIDELYQQLLKRKADASGLANFSKMVASGQSWDDVYAGIIGSSEYLKTRANNQLGQFVGVVYPDMLNRPVDSATQFSSTQALQNGTPRTQVVINICEANEFCEVQIQNAYSEHMERTADTSGLKYWAGRLEKGESFDSVLSAFLTNSEYTRRG
jgi:hypothetical protein